MGRRHVFHQHGPHLAVSVWPVAEGKVKDRARVAAIQDGMHLHALRQGLHQHIVQVIVDDLPRTLIVHGDQS